MIYLNIQRRQSSKEERGGSEGRQTSSREALAKDEGATVLRLAEGTVLQKELPRPLVGAGGEASEPERLSMFACLRPRKMREEEEMISPRETEYTTPRKTIILSRRS